MAGTSIADSAESYKKRSVSLFRNPLDHSREQNTFLENLNKTVPKLEKPITFVKNHDLIGKGTGEAEHGINKINYKNKLLGHGSDDYKRKILAKL